LAGENRKKVLCFPPILKELSMANALSLHETILAARHRLRDAGCATPDLDARLLIGAALGLDRAALLCDGSRILTTEENARLEPLIDRRVAREPVARILGQRDFWDLPFRLNKGTLEPRPDSELLIETALALPLPAAPNVLDLGTGTGCLLLAFLQARPDAHGVGLDASAEACAAARANADALGLADRATILEGRWGPTGLVAAQAEEAAALQGPFDLVLSNPPYIATAEIDTLMPEVRTYDPRLALDGGADGLQPYRLLIPLFPPRLSVHGWVLVEIGATQGPAVEALFRAQGFSVETLPDLAGLPRCVKGTRNV
jgi:release factor glutamine methyltransferase